MTADAKTAMSRGATSLAELEQLLNAVRDQAPAAMDEALMTVQSRHTVHAAINIQLQGALGYLRIGCTDDAVEWIKRALDIHTRWAVPACPLELRRLAAIASSTRVKPQT